MPADLSLALMGPYRIHNAGARKKTEEKMVRNCAPVQRMFSRIMLLPCTKKGPENDIQRAAHLANVKYHGE